MSERVKEVAREEIEQVKALATDAAKSGAYLYPVKGIFYFATHRALWKPLLSRLAPTITTGVGVTTFMFFFTYLPQAAIMTLFNGPLAVLTTILLVLSESSTIANIVSRALFIEEALVDTFDGTLVECRQEALVSSGRELKRGNDAVARLGKLIRQPFARFSPKAILRYLMYLPLNFIPVVGTVLFVVLQGRKFGPNAHARYFQLKGMSATEKEAFIHKRHGAYAAFGVPAVLLEMIPVAGLFFAFTNTVGAALWAVELEQRGTTAPRLQEQAKKAQ